MHLAQLEQQVRDRSPRRAGGLPQFGGRVPLRHSATASPSICSNAKPCQDKLRQCRQLHRRTYLRRRRCSRPEVCPDQPRPLHWRQGCHRGNKEPGATTTASVSGRLRGTPRDYARTQQASSSGCLCIDGRRDRGVPHRE